MEQTGGALTAANASAEKAAAELIGRALFAFSRLDVALGLCVVWTGEGGTLIFFPLSCRTGRSRSDSTT